MFLFFPFVPMDNIHRYLFIDTTELTATGHVKCLVEGNNTLNAVQGSVRARLLDLYQGTPRRHYKVVI